MAFNNATNNYATSRFIVSQNPGEGNYTTIASAISAASDGDVIFLMPGVYVVSNLALKAGVGMCGWTATGDFGEASVVIQGNMIDNGVGLACNFQNITFDTDGDYSLELTGTGSSISFFSCNFNAGDFASFSMNEGTQNIFLYQCIGDVGDTGIPFWNQSNGDIWFYNCQISNDGSSTTPPGITGGGVSAYGTNFGIPLAAANASLYLQDVVINTSGINTACVTLSSSATAIVNGGFYASGTASALIAGSGTTMTINEPIIQSSNANQIST